MKRIIFFVLLVFFFTPAKAYSVEAEKVSNRVQILPPKKDEKEYNQNVKEAEKTKKATDLYNFIYKCGNYSKNINFEEGRKCLDKAYEIAKKNFNNKSEEIMTLSFIIGALSYPEDFDEAEKRLGLFDNKGFSNVKDISLSKIVTYEANKARKDRSEDLMNRALNNLNKIFDKSEKELTIKFIIGNLYAMYGKEEAVKALDTVSNKKFKNEGLYEITSEAIIIGKIDDALEFCEDLDDKHKQLVYEMLANDYANKNNFDEAEKFINKLTDKEKIDTLKKELENFKESIQNTKNP